MGMLAGGDYSRGLERVGITSALELVALFANKTNSIKDELEKVHFLCFKTEIYLIKALTSLKCITEWIISEDQSDKLPKSLSGLRRTIQANNSKLLKVL